MHLPIFIPNRNSRQIPKGLLNFFQKDRLQDAESSKDTATNRLKLVLMQDRSNLDGATMQKMREQLITVISKYVEIDQEALDLNLEADGDEIALMLNIPVIRARTKEEIEEIEAQEQEALNALKNDSEEENAASDDTDDEASAEESSDNNQENNEGDDNSTDTEQQSDENPENPVSDNDSQENDSSDSADNDENSESETESSEDNTNEHKKSKKNKNN